MKYLTYFATAALAFTTSCSYVSNKEKVVDAEFSMDLVGRYDAGIRGEEGVLEIGAYDETSKRLFLSSYDKSVWIVDISTPAAPKKLKKVDLGHFGKGATSIAAHDGLIAVALVGKTKQDKGHVAFLNSNGDFLASIEIAEHPDMLTFTPDGKTVLVAGEGEPSKDYKIDPKGTVSIIDLSNGPAKAKATILNFDAFSLEQAKQAGVRIAGKNKNVSQDVEPEYITVSKDGKTAWVAMQENNAFAIVDIKTKKITKIVGLGYKDHSIPGNALDASNKDDKINIKTWPVRGLYMPDAIASYEVDGKTYILSANEGDSREYEGFEDESRIGKVKLDPKAFPNAAELQEKKNLGRLKMLNTEGDIDGDGDYDQLYSMGARSFSIWDEDGKLVWDSGKQFADITAERYPKHFNATEDENDFDDRSDDKGCEPEGVVVGEVNGQKVAFICLERIGGVMAYNVDNPKAPKFLSYVNNRDFTGDWKKGTAGDVSPEGLVFIPADQSPTGKALVSVVYEMSGTVGLYEVEFK